MRITEKIEADVTVLELTGALSLGPGEDAFRQKMNGLIESKQANILLDFNQVEFIDSSGVGALVKYLTTITRNGGRLKCTRPGRTIEKVLKITGVYDLFDFHNDQKEAIAAFHDR
jgi:anti-sigma B factor antagonist